MRSPLAVAAVCFQTRHRQHQKAAMERCKNYGLKRLTATFWIGRLNATERVELNEKFQHAFTGKTERFFFFPICKSCYATALLEGFEKGAVDNPPFIIS